MKVVIAALVALCLLSVGGYVWVVDFDDALKPRQDYTTVKHLSAPLAAGDATATTRLARPPTADQRPMGALSPQIAEGNATPPAPARRTTPQGSSGISPSLGGAQPAYDLFSDDPTRPLYPTISPAVSTVTAAADASVPTQEFPSYDPEKQAIAQSTPLIDPAAQAAADRIAQAGRPPKHH